MSVYTPPRLIPFHDFSTDSSGVWVSNYCGTGSQPTYCNYGTSGYY